MIDDLRKPPGLGEALSLAGTDRRGREIHMYAPPGHLDTAVRRGSGEVRPFPDHLKPKRIIKAGSFCPSEAPSVAPRLSEG